MNARYLVWLMILIGGSPSGLWGQTLRDRSQLHRQAPLLRPAEPNLVDLRVDQDTTFPPALLNLACGSSFDSLAIYVLGPSPNAPDQWGYIAGPNSYGDREVALRYETAGIQGLAITQLWGFFSAVRVVEDGNVQAHLYDVDADGKPSQRVASSTPQALSTVSTVGGTYFDLATPLNVSQSELMVALDFSDLYNTEDSMTVLTTRFDCASASDLSYLRLATGPWVSFAAPGNEGGWGAPLEVLLGYVFEVSATSVFEPDAYLRQGHLTLFPPCQEEHRLQLGLQSPEAAPYQLAIVDPAGRRLWQQRGEISPGLRRDETIDVMTWSPGVYTVLATSGNSRLMLKFVLR
jgi:hypothetical protein